MNMPLWLDLWDGDDIPEGDDLLSWCARAVDEILEEEREGNELSYGFDEPTNDYPYPPA